MGNLIYYLKNIFGILSNNLLNFHITASNPWVWIFSVILFFVLLRRWGIKKLLLFVVVLAVLIFVRLKLLANLDAKGLIKPDNFTLMVVDVIFYIILSVVVMYFTFIKE